MALLFGVLRKMLPIHRQITPGGEEAEDEGELIVLINSHSVSVSVSSSPQSWSSAGMLHSLWAGKSALLPFPLHTPLSMGEEEPAASRQ